MKPGKSSIVLTVVVLLLIGGVGLYNFVRFAPPAPPTPDAQEVAKKDISEEDRKQTGDSVKDMIGKARRGDLPGAPDEMTQQGDVPEKATIVLEKFQATRPVPNDSDTGSIWWDEDSRAKAKNDELKGVDRGGN